MRLLDALPIAAAIIGLTRRRHAPGCSSTTRASTTDRLHGRPAARSTGSGRLSRRRRRSADLADATSSTATATPPSELDFRDGEGLGRPLFPDQAGAAAARRPAASPRCLLSLVDRTVEVQAERTLARRNAARQPDRPAQPAGLHRDDREGRRERRRATTTMPCWSSTCCASAGSTRSMGSLAGDELLITFARRLISALARRRRAGADRRQRIRRAGGAAARRRRCAGRGRANPGGDGHAVQAVRTRNPRRMRDRRRADARRPGCRRAVPQRPVRGQAGQGGRQAAGL